MIAEYETKFKFSSSQWKTPGKHLCQGLFFNKVAGLRPLKKEAMVQVFSCEFCESFKNTFLTEHLRVVASASLSSETANKNLIIAPLKLQEKNLRTKTIFFCENRKRLLAVNYFHKKLQGLNAPATQKQVKKIFSKHCITNNK